MIKKVNVKDIYAACLEKAKADKAKVDKAKVDGDGRGCRGVVFYKEGAVGRGALNFKA